MRRREGGEKGVSRYLSKQPAREAAVELDDVGGNDPATETLGGGVRRRRRRRRRKEKEKEEEEEEIVDLARVKQLLLHLPVCLLVKPRQWSAFPYPHVPAGSQLGKTHVRILLPSHADALDQEALSDRQRVSAAQLKRILQLNVHPPNLTTD
eukprot:236624-Hanusia_phi.AAC.1